MISLFSNFRYLSIYPGDPKAQARLKLDEIFSTHYDLMHVFNPILLSPVEKSLESIF